MPTHSDLLFAADDAQKVPFILVSIQIRIILRNIYIRIVIIVGVFYEEPVVIWDIFDLCFTLSLMPHRVGYTFGGWCARTTSTER